MNQEPAARPDQEEVRQFACVVPRTARYFLFEGKEAVEELVLAVHGYGQSARAFLEEVRPSLAPGQALIAPEGLSRFYRRGFDGEVVASWMTREDRLSEITDHCRFLDQVVEEVQLRWPGAPLRVMGFSQGVATVSRWLARRKKSVRQLILWAGTMPDDGTPGDLKGKIDAGIHLVYGDTDPLFNPQNNRTVREVWDALGLPVLLHRYPGAHHLDGPLLAELLRH